MEKIFYLFCYLSFLMLLGIFIRSRVKIIEKLFIPASLIGGICGLLINPFFIPKEWIREISLLPGVLIVPVVASVPLGLKFKGLKEGGRDIVATGGIMFMVTFLQIATGYGVNFLFENILGWNVYRTFGVELNAGFAGGHGTAGLIGRTLKEMNMEYWSVAQGITSTLATFGLVGGLLLGISLINRQRGDRRAGEEKNLRNTARSPVSSESLFIHTSIIFTVCGASYILVRFIRAHRIPLLSSLSVWSIGMILMFLVWKGMEGLKVEHLVDTGVKSRVTGFLTEFAIVAAVSTLPLKAVFSYAGPLLVITLLGFMVTWGSIRVLTRIHFRDNHSFEREISILGTSLGVFLTGIVLLRICDPDFKTPVLKDYSLGFSLVSFAGPLVIVSSMELSLRYGVLAPIFLNLGLLVLTSIFLLLYRPQRQFV